MCSMRETTWSLSLLISQQCYYTYFADNKAGVSPLTDLVFVLIDSSITSLTLKVIDSVCYTAIVIPWLQFGGTLVVNWLRRWQWTTTFVIRIWEPLLHIVLRLSLPSFSVILLSLYQHRLISPVTFDGKNNQAKNFEINVKLFEGTELVKNCRPFIQTFCFTVSLHLAFAVCCSFYQSDMP